MSQAPRNTSGASFRMLLLERLAACAPHESVAAAAVARLDTLGRRLTPLVGGEGYRALLARAIALAAREHPCLALVGVESSGSLSGLEETLAGRDASERDAAYVELLAQLLELLVTFVGERITRKLAGDIWPEPAEGVGAEDHEG
ncbi:MAG: hypothetical protein ACK47B_25305 [Armatimonadota bacterium]